MSELDPRFENKICGHCKEIKPLDDFYRNETLCKVCKKFFYHMRNRIKQRPEDRLADIKNRMGDMNHDEYLQMLKDSVKDVDDYKYYGEASSWDTIYSEPE